MVQGAGDRGTGHEQHGMYGLVQCTNDSVPVHNRDNRTPGWSHSVKDMTIQAAVGRGSVSVLYGIDQ